MTLPDGHRIQRQVIELDLAAGLWAPHLQQTLAREAHDALAPALCAAFDAAAGAHQLLRVNRLELDLGTITDADWAPRLRERLVTQISRELARLTPQDLGVPDRGQGAAPPVEPMRQFLYFLVHGRLPWWASRPSGGFSAALAAAGAAPDWAAVRATVQADPWACERLVDALDDAQLEAAIAHWGGLAHASQVQVALAPAAATPAARCLWRRRFWRTLVDWALQGGLAAGRQGALVQALRAAQRVAFGDAGAPALHTPPQAPAPGGPAPLPPGLQALPAPWREWLCTAPGTADGAAAADGARAAPAQTPRVALMAPAHTAVPRRTAAEDDVAPIYLPCVGIVLLHPFLEALFRDRGLLDGRGFCDAAARVRAVHLLGLLGFGSTALPEYELVIAKQLCGHGLSETLDPAALDAADVAACDELLAAVLGHWKALRSSSAQWLRTQFFLRDGKLEPVDGGWRLSVERRAQDVLLTRLPWGLGVITLPWMTDKLFVHWLD